ncbi:MAG: signal recognition particle receptor subunit alpha, partial [Nonlabens ulvanivorans]
MSFFKKIFSKEKKETLDKGLEKTKTTFLDKLGKAVAGKSKVDADVLDDLEDVLISSDVGVATTIKVIDRIEERVAKDKYLGTTELNGILRDEIAGLLSEVNNGDATDFTIPQQDGPYVVMVVGVNGVGKTTTIGKLAHQFKQKGLKVVLGAGDTFRAAAVDQLQIWADRVGVEIVKQ